MTFKHVFWVDAMAFKNHRVRLRFVYIFLTVLLSVVLMSGTSFAKTFASVSPIASGTFIFAAILFLFAISFYINTALQGVELTDEWVNEGNRDGQYWTEHLFLGNMMVFSLFPFLKWVFSQELFTTEGALTSAQLLIELPLTYILFATMVVGVAYLLLCLAFLLGNLLLNLVKEEDHFADKKRALLQAWSICDTAQQEQMTAKIALVEEAVTYYPKLIKKQKEHGKRAIDDMFDHLIQECHRLNEKNLLK